jgi:hypothetical protein
MQGTLCSLVVAAVMCLVGCGGSSPVTSPSSSPSPSAAPSVAAADLVAVAKLTFPYDAQYKYYVVCGVNGDTSRCPYTDRLKARLAAIKGTLCRCQNPAQSLDVTGSPTATGGVAHVVSGSEKFDLIIVRVSSSLLVDDEVCSGGAPSTSIYVSADPC